MAEKGECMMPHAQAVIQPEKVRQPKSGLGFWPPTLLRSNMSSHVGKELRYR